MWSRAPLASRPPQAIIREPPSQTWRTFLENYASAFAALDFFTIPTVTFRVLFMLVVLRHDRRRVVHINVTEHPTAAWTAQQVVEAFPWDSAPRYAPDGRPVQPAEPGVVVEFPEVGGLHHHYGPRAA